MNIVELQRFIAHVKMASSCNPLFPRPALHRAGATPTSPAACRA